ncbi:UDP-glycosyltransferase 90A1-like [Silene latifolia]|uniref:UDP-glycosyltransferase 90A1-like n=1 Tax=Silene latifolia TaxID=37657 RepID=UPI003D772956
MAKTSSSSAQKNVHIALFPFMSKGHTIPLLHLTKLIHEHRPHAIFTIFTTPANEPFISTSLSSLPPTIFTIITFPFRAFDDTLNPLYGVESTDQLPSMSLFHSFAFGTESLLPCFEATVEKLQNGANPITFLICDFFLYWTHNVTSKFDIPRLSFNGMNIYSLTMSIVVSINKIFDGIESNDQAVQLVPDFDWIRLTKNDFDSSLNGPDSDEITQKFLMKVGHASFTSYGLVVNSFEELELPFMNYYNSKCHPKAMFIGPLCLVEKPNLNGSLEAQTVPFWMEWLNKRKDQEEGKPVLYVAFGTQAEIRNEQLKEMALGLARSEVNFIWALRVKPAQEEVLKELEEMVKERGIIVKGWVEQRAILEHESVKGFLSHCGWNSAIESISMSVPILAWPMMAEQHLNARLVVEEIKVGLRVETCDGSVRGFVKWEGLSKMVKELMEGELGKMVRNNVKEYSLMARKAIQHGGSSWSTLNALLNDLESRDGMKQLQ